MDIKDAKAAVGRRCRVIEPHKCCWTMPLTGEYVITGHLEAVEYYDGVPQRTARVQVESVDLRPVRSWTEPEHIELI